MTGFINKFLLFINYLYKTFLRFANIKILFSILSIGFVVFTIIENIEKLSQHSISYNGIYLFFFATLTSIISLFVNALAWQSLLKWMGVDNKKIKIIKLFIRTNLLKYLPGGIWHFVERFRVLNIYFDTVTAFSSVLLEPFLMLAAALFLVPFSHLNNFLYFVFFIPSILLARRWRGSVLMQLYAQKILQFKKLGERLSFNKDSFNVANPSSPYPLEPFLFEILFVLLRFLGFWFCLKTFSIDTLADIFHWVSLFSLAWSIGLIVPSAPGGVGVFESIILLFVDIDVPQELLILALISYRIIVSIADLLVILFVPNKEYIN